MKMRGFFIAAAALVLAGCPGGGGGGGSAVSAIDGTPVITGIAEVGSALGVNLDGVSGEGQPLITWQRAQGGDGGWANHATGATYEVRLADAGHRLRVVVSRLDYLGSVESQPTAVVPMPPDPPMPGSVTITMDAADIDVGVELTAVASGIPDGIAFRWQRARGAEGAFADIAPPATSDTYAVVEGDRGFRLRVVLSRENYQDMASDPTDTVPLAEMPGSVTVTADSPYINVGTVLTAATAGVPADVAFRWQRRQGEDGAFADIAPPATAGTYTVAEGDRGFQIRVAVVHADFADLYSDPSDIVSQVGSVAIVGVPFVGEPLTLDAAGLLGTGALTYRWYRGSGASFEVIAGQTGAGFTPRVEDVGYMIRVVVERAGLAGAAAAMSDGAVFVPFREVALGATHTLAIAEDGSLWAWGNNVLGRLGIGERVGQNVAAPTRVGAGTDWVQVSAGNLFSVGIRGARDPDGSVRGELWVWGGNSHGMLGNGQEGAFAHESAPVRMGSHDDWVQVSAGHSHVAGIRDEGGGRRTLWTWGQNNQNKLGLQGAAAGPSITVPTQVPVGEDWVQVSAGETHTVGIRNEGGDRTLWAWGGRHADILGTGGTIASVATPTQVGTFTDWEYVSAGERHSLGIRNEGGGNRTLWAWGFNDWGVTGQNTEAGNAAAPTRVGTHSDWVTVSAGYATSLGIRDDGAGRRTLWAWGAGEDFRTGLGIAADTLVPTQVGERTDWSRLGTMPGTFELHTHGVAVRLGGTVWAWGGNLHGQTGVAGTTIGGTVPSPSRVFPLR